MPNAVIVATEKQKLANLISAKTGANASTLAAADATTLLKLAAAAGISPSQQSAVAKSGISVPMILLGVGALALFYFAMKNRS